MSSCIDTCISDCCCMCVSDNIMTLISNYEERFENGKRKAIKKICEIFTDDYLDRTNPKTFGKLILIVGTKIQEYIDSNKEDPYCIELNSYLEGLDWFTMLEFNTIVNQNMVNVANIKNCDNIKFNTNGKKYNCTRVNDKLEIVEDVDKSGWNNIPNIIFTIDEIKVLITKIPNSNNKINIEDLKTIGDIESVFSKIYKESRIPGTLREHLKTFLTKFTINED